MEFLNRPGADRSGRTDQAQQIPESVRSWRNQRERERNQMHSRAVDSVVETIASYHGLDEPERSVTPLEEMHGRLQDIRDRINHLSNRLHDHADRTTGPEIPSARGRGDEETAVDKRSGALGAVFDEIDTLGAAVEHLQWAAERNMRIA
jgi:ubiquinone biosynthesis protein UbiJ